MSASQQALLMVGAAAAATPVTVTLDTYNASASGVGSGPFTTSAVTATPSGGTPGYTYLWSRTSGDATISPSSTTVAAPTFSASGTATQTKTATFTCTATDTLSQSGVSSTLTVAITFNAAALSASLNYSSIQAQGFAGGAYQLSTAQVTCTPTGGTGPFTYLWIKNSGDPSTSADASTSQASSFSAYSSPVDTRLSNWKCRVTDSLSQSADSGNVAVELDFL